MKRFFACLLLLAGLEWAVARRDDVVGGALEDIMLRRVLRDFLRDLYTG